MLGRCLQVHLVVVFPADSSVRKTEIEATVHRARLPRQISEFQIEEVHMEEQRQMEGDVS